LTFYIHDTVKLIKNLTQITRNKANNLKLIKTTTNKTKKIQSKK